MVPHPIATEIKTHNFRILAKQGLATIEHLQIQQTPKPDAQVPSVLPPLVEHSSLKCINFLLDYPRHFF